MGIVYVFTYTTKASTWLEKFEEDVKWTGIKWDVVRLEPVTQTRGTPLLNDLRKVKGRPAATELRLTIYKAHQYHDQYLPLPVVRSLSVSATKTLVQAFLSCRLDYCNSLLFGISDGLLRRLQSVQNAAAWSQAPVGVTTSHPCYGS